MAPNSPRVSPLIPSVMNGGFCTYFLTRENPKKIARSLLTLPPFPSPKSEIGKKRAETGARNPRPKDRNATNFLLETGAPHHLNARECGRFPALGKIRSRD
jgi:hypothetical protein